MNQKPRLEILSNNLSQIGTALLVLAFCVVALFFVGLCLWAWFF